jgi:alpha-beta hydrolase superfamily lysophospholipase
MLGILAAMASVTLLSNCQCGRNYNLVSHTFRKPQLRDKHYTTEDAQTFPYRRFIAKDHTPSTIIIALHGFCGASIDYEILGNHLNNQHPQIGLYAYEVRGQGLDPVRERRGDIDNIEN